MSGFSNSGQGWFPPVFGIGSGGIGGIAPEAAGATGSIYEGYKLSWGDDFTAPLNLVGPSAHRGKYFPTRIYAISPGPGMPQRGASTGVAVLADPRYTGYLDHNSGVEVGYNNIRQESSVLTLQARLATASETAHFQEPATNLNISSIVSTPGAIVYYPGTSAPNIVEARVRILPEATDSPPRGCSISFVTYSATPVTLGGTSDENDILEGYSDVITSNDHTWAAGSVSGNNETEFDDGDIYDGEWHTVSCIEDKSQKLVYIDGTLKLTAARDQNAANKPKFIALTSFAIGGTQSGITFTQSDWTALGSGLTGGQRLETDWLRVWRPSAAAHYRPLTSIDDLSLAYAGAGSIVLPSKTSLWGDADVEEYVQIVPTEANEPGTRVSQSYSQFPSGVTYDSGTRTVSVDWSATLGHGGTCHGVVMAYKTNGSTCEPARFTITRTRGEFVTFLGHNSVLDAVGSSKTFSGEFLGAAAANRSILVGITSRGSGTRTIDSVSIGGVSATEVATIGNGSTRISFFVAAVPNGTTGDVAINLTGVVGRFVISKWRLIGLASTTATDTLSDISFASDQYTGTIDVSAGGAIFVMTYVALVNETHTYAGVTKDFSTFGPDAGSTVSAGHDAFTGALTNRTVTLTSTGSGTPSDVGGMLAVAML